MTMHKALRSESPTHDMVKDATHTFLTKEGWLTSYALACGYVESVSNVRMGAVKSGGLVYWVSTEYPHRRYFRSVTAARRYCTRLALSNTTTEAR